MLARFRFWSRRELLTSQTGLRSESFTVSCESVEVEPWRTYPSQVPMAAQNADPIEFLRRSRER